MWMICLPSLRLRFDGDYYKDRKNPKDPKQIAKKPNLTLIKKNMIVTKIKMLIKNIIVGHHHHCTDVKIPSEMEVAPPC